MARKKINPTSRTRTVELDGKPYTIEFNFLAYDAMKQLTGISLFKGWDESVFDAKEYACLLFAGLITHYSDIEIGFCQTALYGENFVDVVKVLFEAYSASLPKAKEDPNPKQPIVKS
jgi:hypothetical protein